MGQVVWVETVSSQLVGLGVRVRGREQPGVVPYLSSEERPEVIIGILLQHHTIHRCQARVESPILCGSGRGISYGCSALQHLALHV